MILETEGKVIIQMCAHEHNRLQILHGQNMNKKQQPQLKTVSENAFKSYHKFRGFQMQIVNKKP